MDRPGDGDPCRCGHAARQPAGREKLIPVCLQEAGGRSASRLPVRSSPPAPSSSAVAVFSSVPIMPASYITCYDESARTGQYRTVDAAGGRAPWRSRQLLLRRPRRGRTRRHAPLTGQLFHFRGSLRNGVLGKMRPVIESLHGALLLSHRHPRCVLAAWPHDCTAHGGTIDILRFQSRIPGMITSNT